MSAPTTSPSSLLTLNGGDLHTAARAYASMGWPVLPLVAKEKRPANYNGLTGASEDLEQIDEWWTKWPAANIGLRTGIAFDVLDVDGPEGVLSLGLTTVEHTGTTKYHHPGPVQSTGKGYHLLFLPTGARNFAGRYPGLDFRGQNGYIVASPSIHPNGHQYRWARDGTPPEPPNWLHSMLIPTRTTAPSSLYAPEDLAPIAEVWNATYAILGSQHELSPLGARYITSCPWHDDSTPSLVLYPENNSFYCFGCSEWGDTLDLGNIFPAHPKTPTEFRADRHTR
ncbi:MAG: bifunctional DNA primase/polymerase [Acidimicrobiia bacterium]